MSYNWPGNVRQLMNVLEYGAITCKTDLMELHHLPEYILEKEGGEKSVNNSGEKKRVIAALRQHNYNRTKTAEYLNISRVALWKKMKKLEISV